MSRDLPIVILAGGEGRRIGGGKPARLLAGRSLIDHALERARGWSDRVAVAVREEMGEVDAPLIRDDQAIAGPLGGLAAALRFARSSGAPVLLTLPCDMPLLPDDLPERLGTAIGDAQAALAASGGLVHPVCGLWRVEALDRLDDYVATGRRSLRGFAEAVGFVAAVWPAEPVDPFFNINDEADLARAEEAMRG